MPKRRARQYYNAGHTKRLPGHPPWHLSTWSTCSKPSECKQGLLPCPYTLWLSCVAQPNSKVPLPAAGCSCASRCWFNCNLYWASHVLSARLCCPDPAAAAVAAAALMLLLLTTCCCGGQAVCGGRAAVSCAPLSALTPLPAAAAATSSESLSPQDHHGETTHPRRGPTNVQPSQSVGTALIIAAATHIISLRQSPPAAASRVEPGHSHQNIIIIIVLHFHDGMSNVVCCCHLLLLLPLWPQLALLPCLCLLLSAGCIITTLASSLVLQ